MGRNEQYWKPNHTQTIFTLALSWEKRKVFSLNFLMKGTLLQYVTKAIGIKLNRGVRDGEIAFLILEGTR